MNGAFANQRHGREVTGVELGPEMVEGAHEHLHAVHVADLNQASRATLIGGERFDLIVFGDVREHLVDRWATLAEARALLGESGSIISALPSEGHYSSLVSLLLLRRRPFRAPGVHDSTHLRFFARRNLLEPYECAGLAVPRRRRKLRLFDPSPLNRLAKFLDFPPPRAHLAHPYIHCLGVRAPAAAALP